MIDQKFIDKTNLGKDSNAIVWPREPSDEEDDDEGPENFKNQRYMRIGVFYSGQYICVCANLLGENPRDMDISDEEESSSDIEEEEEDYMHSDAESSISIAPVKLGLMADAEFRTEVTQSLERAFVEGHSVDNAAVELKTLRMASNVPLIRVKEAVVAAIVEKIPMVEGDAPSQRREIHRVISRWGELINRIGGVDPVETISILQVTFLLNFFFLVGLNVVFISGSLCWIYAYAIVWADISCVVPRRHRGRG